MSPTLDVTAGLKTFDQEVDDRVSANGRNAPLVATAREFTPASALAKYSYSFSWLGRQVIQYPENMLAMQDLVGRVQPNLIIETGIAQGGSLVLSASVLELNAACGGPKAWTSTSKRTSAPPSSRL